MTTILDLLGGKNLEGFGDSPEEKLECFNQSLKGDFCGNPEDQNAATKIRLMRLHMRKILY